jgi:hypothetical protein
MLTDASQGRAATVFCVEVSIYFPASLNLQHNDTSIHSPTVKLETARPYQTYHIAEGNIPEGSNNVVLHSLFNVVVMYYPDI